MYSINSKTLSYPIIFLVGALGFSHISTLLTVNFLHLPVFFPEPFFLIFFFFLFSESPRLYKPQFFTPTKILTFLFFLVLWIALIMFAILEGPLFEALSTGRPFLYALIASSFSGYLKKFDIKFIYVFLLGIIIGELINLKIIAFIDMNYRGIGAVNLMAVFLISSLSVLSKKKMWLILTTVFTVPLVLLSGFRTAIFSLFLGYFFALCIRIIRSYSFFDFLKKILYSGFFLFIAISFGYGLLNSGFLQLEQFTYFRIVNRMLSFLGGNIYKSQDIGRLSKIVNYLKDGFGGILPSGFVMRTRDLIGDFNDVPFLYFTITFGVFFGLIIIGLLLTAGLIYSLTRLHSKNADVIDLVAVSFFPFFIFLLLINGRFGYILYESILWGLLVGYWFWALFSSRYTFRTIMQKFDLG